MNEETITNFLKNYIGSINDMKTPLFDIYREKFYKENKTVIGKYIPKSKRYEIYLRNIFSKYIWEIDGLFHKEGINFSFTRIKLGKFNTLIPFEINCAMESILTKDLRISGLFRQSTTTANLKECHEKIQFCRKKNITRLEVINILKQIDIITLTSVYKQLYDQYSMPLVPRWALKTFVSISDIENDIERIILIKYLIYYFPKANRNLLDSITRFFALIQHFVSDMEESSLVNMDMHGFAVVMMPQIFLKHDYILDLSGINKLIDVLEFIFLKRNILFSVGIEERGLDGFIETSYFDLKNEANMNCLIETEGSESDYSEYAV